jgi:hypothetical protein
MDKNRKAENEARANGFDGARHIGTTEDGEIYIATANDSRPTGLPLFIRINPDDTVWSDYCLDYMDLIKE